MKKNFTNVRPLFHKLGNRKNCSFLEKYFEIEQSLIEKDLTRTEKSYLAN